MTFTTFRPGVLALGLLGAAVAVAVAADPPVPAAPQRQIVRWPGGWMYLDEPGVIYHDGSAPKSGTTTVITGSANGVGNRIVVDNGNTPGTTILRDVRNGVGNSVTVTPAGPVIKGDPEGKPGRPEAEYKGKGNPFWTRKVRSKAYDCTLYWCPKTQWWFRWDKAADAYRPLPIPYDPTEDK